MAQEITKEVISASLQKGLKGRNCILSRRRDHFLTGAPPRLHSRSRPARAATITRRPRWPRCAGNLATALSVMSWNAGGLSAQGTSSRSGLLLAHIMRSAYRRHTGLALLSSGRAAGMILPVATVSICNELLLNAVCWSPGHATSVHSSTGHSLECRHSADHTLFTSLQGIPTCDIKLLPTYQAAVEHWATAGS